MESDRTPSRPAAPPVSSLPPLSEEDFLALRQAAAEYKVIRRTVKTARNSAMTTLIIGALALLATFPFTEWLGTVTAVGVCVVGVVEFVGAGRLRREEPGATRMLCVNQLSFLALVVAYCLIQMATLTSAKGRDAALSPEVRSLLVSMPEMQKSIDRLAPLFIYALYGGTILLSGLFQGRLAWSYRACGRRLAAFESHTPARIRRLLREAQTD